MIALLHDGLRQEDRSRSFLGTEPKDVYAGPVSQFSWQTLARLSSENFVLGYISYDQGRLPGFWFGVFPWVLVQDHKNKAVYRWFANGQRVPAEWPRLPSGPYSLGQFTLDQTKEDYLRTIDGIKSEIKDGHYYQINYTIRATAPFQGDPLGLFRDFMSKQPVAYGAFIDTGRGFVVSGSPEMFLRIEPGLALSEPMKGTRPGHLDPKELLRSSKDRAENLMIADLVRHDLGKVSQRVEVQELFRVRSYATVHQMISVIKGFLKPETQPVDVLRACFPPGSITGAPKSSATEAINRWENTPRGVYTGVIGMLTPFGTGVFSVAIRTCQIIRNRLIYGIGGGITFASDPESEWQECILKLRAIQELSK